MTDNTLIRVVLADEGARFPARAKAFLEKSGSITVQIVESVEEVTGCIFGNETDLLIIGLGISGPDTARLLGTIRKKIPSFPCIRIIGEDACPGEVRLTNPGCPVIAVRGPDPCSILPELERRIFKLSGKKAQNKIFMNSENELRSFFEHFPGIVHRMTINFEPVFLFGDLEKISGYRQEEFESGERNWLDIVYPEDLKGFRRFEKPLRTVAGFSAEHEYRILRKDGAIGWIHEVIHTVCDEHGKPAAIDLVAQDITEKKKAESTIKQEKELWEKTFDSIPDLVAIIDTEFRITKANLALAGRLGKKPDELVGMFCHQIFHGTDDPVGVCPHLRLLEDGKEHFSEIHIPRLGGDFEISVSPLFDETGRISGAVHIARDITEKKKAEEALRVSEERYRTLIETANEAIFVIQDERVKFFNPQLEQLTGYSPEELRELSFTDVVHPDDLPIVVDRYHKRLVGERLADVYAFRFLNKQKNHRWAEVNAIQISWDGKPATLNFLTDITERKLAEDRLTGLNTAFTRLTPYYAKNIALLTETAGKLIGATIMLYNRIEGDQLLSIGAWNTPLDFIRARPAEGSICGEVIRSGQEAGMRIVPNLDQTPYYTTNPNLGRYGYRTYVGYPVHSHDRTIGSLCAFYQEDKVPDETARMMIGIIASAISVEEEREFAEQELKSREAILEAINFAAETLLASPNWETTIVSVLARIGAAAHVDRVVIFKKKHSGPDSREYSITPRFEWRGPGAESIVENPLSGQFSSDKLFRRLEMGLSQGEYIYGNIDDFPPDERDSFLQLKIRSLAAFPIFVDNIWWGFVGFETCTHKRTWTKSEIDALAVAASILGTSIQRTRIEELYHYPMEQSPVGIYVLQDRKFAYINLKFARMYGSTREEIMGLDALDLVVPEDQPKVLKMIRKRITGEIQHAHYEFRSLRKNGEEIVIEAYTINGYYDGRPAIIGNVLDITDQRRAKEALAASEERLRLTLDATEEGLWDWNFKTGSMYLSPRFYTMLGYEPYEFAASYKNYLSLVHPDDVPIVAGEINDHVKYKPEGYQAEFRMKTKSGDYLWILSRGKVVEQDCSGIPVRMVGTHLNITERRRAEDILLMAYENLTASEEELREQYDALSKSRETIRESEERFRTLFESANDAIFVLDNTGNFIRCNKKSADLFGCAGTDELVGRTPFDFSPAKQPDGAGSKEKAIEKIRSAFSGTPQTFEWVHTRKDGTSFYSEISLNLLTIEGKSYIQAIVRDISQRKAAEEALNMNRIQLANAMDLSHLVKWEFDVATGMFTFDDRFYALYATTAEREGGYRMPAEVYMRVFVHPDDVHDVAEKIKTAVTTRDSQFADQIEHRIIRRDGEVRTIIARYAVITGPGGDVISTFGANQDVTERKRAEEALRLSEEQFRRTFDQSPVGAAITSLDFHFIKVNEALCKILGYTKDELIGLSFADVTHPDYIDVDLSNVRRLASGELAEFQTEKRYIRKDDRVIWARLSSRAVRDSTGSPIYYLPIMIDITEEKENRIALQRRDALLIAINIAAERLIRSSCWEDSLGDILEQMGKAAEVGRASIFQFTGDKELPQYASALYEWVDEGVEPLIEDPRMKNIPFRELGLDMLYTALVSQNHFTGSVCDFPEKAKSLFSGTAVNALLLVPVLVENEPWGFICFDNAAPERRIYHPVEIEALQVAADILGSTISRTQYEKQLETSLEEGVVLLREVHHRVRNNMQVISSLLSIQSTYITDPVVLSYMQETESRIKSMALVHEKLYQSDSFATIEIGDYLRNLVADLVATYTVRARIHFRDDIENGITLDLERAIPFGLIIHEIVANSLRHAFRNRDSGTIFLSMHTSADGMAIIVRIGDDGCRAPDVSMDLEHAKTMGLQLISVLTRQIDGTIRLCEGQGTEYEIIFPAREKAKTKIAGK